MVYGALIAIYLAIFNAQYLDYAYFHTFRANADFEYSFPSAYLVLQKSKRKLLFCK